MSEPLTPPLVSPAKLTLTFVAVMLLFAATFFLAHVDLGPLNVLVGLLIAAAKALLVAIYFMNLRHSSGIHRVAAGVGIFWLGILVSLSMTDYISRNWLLLPSLWPAIH